MPCILTESEVFAVHINDKNVKMFLYFIAFQSLKILTKWKFKMEVKKIFSNPCRSCGTNCHF